MSALLAIGLLAVVVIAERAARRLIGSRAAAWIVAYGALGLASLALGASVPSGGSLTLLTVGGVALAVVGYPAGRRILNDKPDQPPQDSLALELFALAIVVAPAEELIWGAVVEPAIGIPATAVVFALKHPLVDGRWRRTLGLSLFWVGLGVVRAWSWPAALVLHMSLNAAGVLLGHRSNQDQF